MQSLKLQGPFKTNMPITGKVHVKCWMAEQVLDVHQIICNWETTEFNSVNKKKKNPIH